MKSTKVNSLIMPGMIRLSVGIENIEKLEKVIVTTLDSLNGENKKDPKNFVP